MVISGGDDGAFAGHCIDLSIQGCVVARGKQSLAHAAQITGWQRPIRSVFVIAVTILSVCLSVTSVIHA